ncbi:hypothetical protein [Rubripirellula obstinata]|nr:hypothetical protein [Rubripirellula obstinata]
MTSRPPTDRSPSDSISDWQMRRRLVLVISVVLLIVSAFVSWQFGNDSTARFAASASGRIGLVMAALWLAWPSLKRPAAWLPPGIAVGLVVALAVVAAQPRLIIVAVPAIGILFTLASVVRSFRS